MIRNCLCIMSIYFFLSGCSVGPEYIPPVALVPSTFSEGGTQTASNNPLWWRSFHDVMLNRLIEESAVCNLTVKTAEARVNAARVDYAVAYAQLFPKLSANLLPPDGTGTGLTQVLALTAALEPDLWGKL